jgi:DNA-binding PadR family transcriptional regulator
MRAHAPLGEFEQLVLCAILQRDGEAHGIEIRREIEARAERRVSRGALYTALERLESKGLLEWRQGDSVPERGGLPRRCYSVTAEGLRLLRATFATWSRMTDGIAEMLDET